MKKQNIETTINTQEEFFFLSEKLFSKKTSSFFSAFIPEKYYPLNVYVRAVNDFIEGTMDSKEYAEAVGVYKALLQRLYNPN